MVFVAIFSGCTSTKTFTQEELRADREHDITVRTNDGRKIIFREGEYKIIDDDYGSIQGKGRLVVSEIKNEYRDWEGIIAFTEIQNIESSQATPLGTAGSVLFVTAVVLLAVLVLFPPEINFH